MFASEVSLKSDLRGKEGHFLLPPKSASSVIPSKRGSCGRHILNTQNSTTEVFVTCFVK